MGGRYIITGSQIGLLKVFIDELKEKSKKDATEILEQIQEAQFIGDSDRNVEEDMMNITDWWDTHD